MPLFSRRKPPSGAASGVPAGADGASDEFSVPAPIFDPVPDPTTGPNLSASPTGRPVDGGPTEPRDPNAPPIPGAPAARAAAPAPAAVPEQTPEELEAQTARFRRPGSRGRRSPRQPSARRKRAETARAAKSSARGVVPPSSRQAATDATGADESPSTPPDASSNPTRGRSVLFLSPPALLALSVVIGLLAVLLVVLFQPGATAWAVVAALVLIGAVQLALFVGSIIVINRKTSRRLGVLALIVLLVVNPLTATMVRGITSVATGGGISAGGDRDDHDPIWDTYPGSAYVDAKDTLDGLSHEEFAEQSDLMLEEMRTALTAEFGFEWEQRQPAESEIDTNGYGGESTLYSYDAPVWQTTTTVRTFEEKSRVVEILRQVLLRYGIANLDMQNAPASWREPGELTEQYGGETIDTQALWDLNTYDVFTRSGSFQASIVDLDLDSAGTVAEDREFDVEYYGMAAEGIELHLDAYALLKEADRADYLTALEPYADLEKPE